MDLRTKPSDAPNSFFSLMMTKQSSQTDKRPDSKSSVNLPSAKQQPNTTRQQNTFQQFYESITKPFFNAASGIGSKGLIKPGAGPVRSIPQGGAPEANQAPEEFSRTQTAMQSSKARHKGSDVSNKRSHSNVPRQLNATGSGRQSLIPQAQKDGAKIANLQQELDVAKREKNFIQDKLSEVMQTSPDKSKEHEQQIQFERYRYEQAEEGRLHLQAQIDLIQEYIDHEE